MNAKKLLEILHTAEKLKDITRHAYTSGGRHESVAEHSWRIAFMALLLKDEFPRLDMNKVMQMCIIHDLGEIFTGDIPTFLKTQADAQNEDDILDRWVSSMPDPVRSDLQAIYDEMNAQQTTEAKLYKALDKLEAVIQHNESPIDTWEELEYDLNRTYAWNAVEFSPYMQELRQAILDETNEKIAREAPDRE